MPDQENRWLPTRTEIRKKLSPASAAQALIYFVSTSALTAIFTASNRSVWQKCVLAMGVGGLTLFFIPFLDAIGRGTRRAIGAARAIVSGSGSPQLKDLVGAVVLATVMAALDSLYVSPSMARIAAVASGGIGATVLSRVVIANSRRATRSLWMAGPRVGVPAAILAVAVSLAALGAVMTELSAIELFVASVGFGVAVPVAAALIRLAGRISLGGWRAGLRRTFPVATYPLEDRRVTYRPRASRAAQQALQDAVGGYQSVKLLLVSGFFHLGTRGEPGCIARGLEKHRVLELEVVLLDPEGKIAHARDALLGSATRSGAYSDGIREVIQLLRQWADTRPYWRVQVWLYDEEPIWQMAVLGAEELWLLTAAQGVTSGYSPVYRFNLKSHHGLGWGLAPVWSRRKASARGPIDFRDDAFVPRGEIVDLRSESSSPI